MSFAATPILIDGTYGEGGGALLRAAVVMSALTQQPLRITGIRGDLKHSGLDWEDLTVVKALAQTCGAEVVGAELGSSTLNFEPKHRPKGLNHGLESFGLGNRAPSVPTVLNTLLPVLSRGGTYSSVSLKGETYGKNALSYDYFANVTLMAHRAFGLYSFSNLEEAGFGRESEGEISLDVEPSSLNGVDWSERGEFQSCTVSLSSSGLSAAIRQRGVAHLEKLAAATKLPVEFEWNEYKAQSKGIYLTIWATFENGMGGATAIGAKNIRIESLAQGVFDEFMDWFESGATVDPFLADQILVTASLAEEMSVFKTSRLTKRFLTTAWVIKQFLPIHITVTGAEDQPGTITIRR